MYLLKAGGHQAHEPAAWNLAARFQRAFERGFEALRATYRGRWPDASATAAIFIPAFLALCAALLSAVSVAGAGFLSDHRRRPVQSALPRQDRHAH